jgi:2-aminoadipate transaminase
MKTPRMERLLRAAAHHRGLISFAGGLPAPETFPRSALAECAETAALQLEGSSLQYDWPEGRPGLREQIALRLRARGAFVDVEDVHITNGAQDALSLALDVLNAREVHVDVATYPGALDVFAGKGVAVTTNPSAQLWYVMPAVHNPWGFSMVDERRAQALRATTVLEDDAYADLRFDGPAPRPLLADAPHQVWSIGTFSKTVSPGLRVGWLTAPPAWRGALRDAKARRDVQAGGLAQAIIEQMLSRGDFDDRLEMLRAHYRRRCTRLLELLPRLGGIRFGLPEGGFSVWLETEAVESDEQLLARALRHGVAFDPGTMFRAEPRRHATLAMRLSFSALPLTKFEEGIKRLAWVLAEARSEKKRVAA